MDAETHGTAESDTAFPPAIDSNFLIGWSEGTMGMGGLIDDVVVANPALGDAEITSHFENGLPGLGIVSTAVEARAKLSAMWGDLKAGAAR